MMYCVCGAVFQYTYIEQPMYISGIVESHGGRLNLYRAFWHYHDCPVVLTAYNKGHKILMDKIYAYKNVEIIKSRAYEFDDALTKRYNK